MAGYNWSEGKSNNAVSCENEGKVNKSQITKDVLKNYGIDLSVKDVKSLIENGFIKPCEWHHTSKFFNCTDYYDFEYLAEDLNENREDYIKALDEIKQKQDDVIYAEIMVTFISNIGSKRNPRYDIEEKIYFAEVKGFYSNRTLCSITTFNEKFSKNEKYIKVLKTITKEELEQKNLELLKEQEKKAKKELKENREKLRELAKALDSDIFENKIKKIKSYLDFLNLEKDIQRAVDEKIESDKKAAKIKRANERLNNHNIQEFIDVKDWIALDKMQRHPAPENIQQMKIDSGLSWNEFEDYLKNQFLGVA
jgi:hypothetical protein